LYFEQNKSAKLDDTDSQAQNIMIIMSMNMTLVQALQSMHKLSLTQLKKKTPLTTKSRLHALRKNI
jgi:hypothetical protein